MEVGLRVDSAVYPGSHSTVLLIAKIIVHGENRFDALMKMQRALYELEIDGVMTNSDFQLDLISDSNVIAGDYDTAFLMEHFIQIIRKVISNELCKCEIHYKGMNALQLQSSFTKWGEVDEILFSKRLQYTRINRSAIEAPQPKPEVPDELFSQVSGL